MGYLIHTRKYHKCHLPSTLNVEPGYLYECDDCGKLWRAYWMPLAPFSVLWTGCSKRRAARMLRRYESSLQPGGYGPER